MRIHQLVAVGGLVIAPLVTATRAGAQDAGALYKKRCMGCHGATGKGDGPAAAVVNPKPQDMTDAKRMAQFTDAKLTEVIERGQNSMPAFGSRLKSAEVKALVAYIRSLSEKKRPQ